MAQTAGGTYYAASSELVSSWPATSLDLANQLESRFAAKWTTATAWTSFTPTLKQNGNLAISTNNSKYLVIGNLVHVVYYVIANATGTANNEVRLTLPFNCLGDGTRLGAASVYRGTTATSYSAMAFGRTATEFAFIGDWSGSQFWGQSPNLAVNAGDQYAAVLVYEKA